MSTTAREHHWDGLRAILMLLGIPYHAAMSYPPVGNWIVNSHENAYGTANLAQFIHIFRMPAFYVIAGYFAALLLARRLPGEWLKGRFKRLGIPLVVSFILLCPILNLACELSNFDLAGAVKSLAHNSAKSGGYLVRHLWFLIVLLYLCVVAAFVTSVCPKARTAQFSDDFQVRARRRFPLAFAVVAIIVGLWQACAIEASYMAGLNTNLLQGWLRLNEFIQFAPYFLIGFLLHRAPLLKERLYRFSPFIAGAAVVFIVWNLVDRESFAPWTARFVVAVGALAMTQVIVAVARRAGDRPSPLIREIVDASFVIYLFHMPILCWLVVVLMNVGMAPEVKVLIVTIATGLLSYAMWLVVRRHGWLRLGFDGIARPATRI